MNRRLIVIAALCVAFLETRGHNFDKIMLEIAHERERQNRQWGGPEHDEGHADLEWAFLIMKHVGRLARLIRQPDERYMRDLRDSMIILGNTVNDVI